MLPSLTSQRRSKLAAPSLKRKNMVIDQNKLDFAKEHFGVATETEAVDKALDMIAFRSEVLSGLDALAASGPLRDPYARRRVRRT
jgi:hypothetical protein